MKKFTLSIVSVFASVALFAQGNHTPTVFSTGLQVLKSVQGPQLASFVSPTTAALAMEYNAMKNGESSYEISEQELIEKYGLLKKGNTLYANSFLMVNNNFSPADMEALGVLLNNKKGKTNIYTAMIPVDKIQQIAFNPGVNLVEVGEKATLLVDSARIRTNVNQVHAGDSLPRAFKGAGVVVGIVDVGFDFTHPNFYDSTGTNYRVKRVWNQIATTGTAPAAFSYGAEYTTTSTILAAQRDRTTEDHGSHVGGIAGGSGGGLAQYEGVAPKSDLVFVATTGTTTGLLDGVDYIQQYAQSVGKPCVVNLSWGSHVGPHDGTSSFDRLCDSVFTGPGRILVGSAGNEGRTTNTIYLGKSYTSTDTSLYSFLRFPSGTYLVNGTTAVDIWGEVNKNFSAAVHIYNTSTNQIEASTPFLYPGGTNYNTTTTITSGNNKSTSIQIFTGRDAVNHKPRVYFNITNTAQTDSNRSVMIEVRAKNTSTQMWTNSAIFTNKGKSAPFAKGNNTHTVGEIGGTGNSMITVGAYTTRSSWKSLAGSNWTNSATVGGKADFSSMGPTADGRVKPDISAPGQTLASSVNHYSTTYGSTKSNTVAKITKGSSTWYFGLMQGTSMSAPMVTGIVALWLEMDSTLTPAALKTIMKNNAIKDGFTGTIPTAGSNIWGHGKINAWVNLTSFVSGTPVVTPASADICLGDSVILNAPAGKSAYLWNTGAITRSIKVGSTGTYKVQVWDSGSTIGKWSDDVPVNVHNNPPAVHLGSDTSFCPGGSMILYSGNNNPNATVVWNSSTTGNNYNVTSAGTYIVKVTNQYGCATSDTINISYLPTPPSFNFGNDTSICDGKVYVLSVPILNSNEHVIWNDNSTQRTKVVTTSGFYFATVSNNLGCTTSDTIYVQVNPSPIVSLGGDRQICGSGSLTLSYNGNPSDVISWSNGSNGNTLNITQPGTYHLTVTNAFGCTASDTINVTQGNAPYASGFNATLQSNGSYRFTANNISYVNKYKWEFGDGDSSVLPAPYHTYAKKGSYFVTLTVKNDCGSRYITDVIEIIPSGINTQETLGASLKIYPNPAQDEVNILFDGKQKMQSVVVYNVLGQVVYKSNADVHTNLYRIATGGFASGVYQTRVQLPDGQTIQGKFEIRK